MVSWIGVSRYSKSSGTGRSSERTTASARSVNEGIFSTNSDTSPKVADISKNVAWGSVSSGICQALPRSGSA